ncbi:hypothetical protein BI347_22260 [Chromobacterium sphagni]|uniref:Phage tail protein n=1 Tax=Chromobacterium sphagni TaxID=1903179 RepID=A0A1S1WTG4_9NEIS|nr:hypothetical protein [Chromobacterium sphagni]OHX10503.1 hypothetical protein BI347_22260 [Chromobacterium sphagni]
MKRRTQIQQAIADVIRPLLSPDVLFSLDREEGYEADHLPAVNLCRLSDKPVEAVNHDAALQMRRQLVLSLDLYAEGDARYALLDDIEQGITQALLTREPLGLGGAETISMGEAVFDQETLIAVVCASRIPITIDYTITF